jgi:hypothetical protein
MSLSDACRQLVRINALFKELGIDLQPIPLCGDNQGAIFIASNPVQERRSKHIDIRFHYIRQVLANKEVVLFYIEGNNNPADMLTKNLGHIKFLEYRGKLGLSFVH